LDRGYESQRDASQAGAHGRTRAYNRNSRVQAAGLSPAIPLFERAASTVALAESAAPITIADYGASAGHNSLAPLKAAIGALRQRVGQDRDISVVHTDLPATSEDRKV